MLIFGRHQQSHFAEEFIDVVVNKSSESHARTGSENEVEGKEKNRGIM
jgi:hypothetical protein